MAKAMTRAVPIRNPSQVVGPAAWLAVITTFVTILLLAALHVLSPEFAPSWRVVSEYAFGHYAWVLLLMFLSWGISSWALVVTIWPRSLTVSRKTEVASPSLIVPH
jgi:hypothetical protein